MVKVWGIVVAHKLKVDIIETLHGLQDSGGDHADGEVQSTGEH